MGLFPARVETDRLSLRRLCVDEIAPLDLYRICSAPEMDRVARYMPWDPHETPQETAAFLREMTEAWEAGDHAAYAIRPRESEDGAGAFAGACGIDLDWETRRGHLGVWLRERFQRRGYAGERAAALLAVAFERLDLDYVLVECLEGNDASRAAVERYVDAHGGRYEGLLRGERRVGGEVHDAHRYSIARAEWAAADADVAVRFP
jgi:RimJ/RimL family protein N-acetyltransferase